MIQIFSSNGSFHAQMETWKTGLCVCVRVCVCVSVSACFLTQI